MSARRPARVNWTRRAFLQSSAAAAAAGCASAPPEQAAKPPNLLLLFPDQHRFDWTAANPAIPVRTPHLDRLNARGVRFTNAVCASPLCAPSRACLAAGKEYGRAGVPDNSLNYPLEQTTYYSLLRDAGYHVMGCGKFDLHKPEFSWGRDGRHLLPEWGFSAGIDSAGKWDALRWGAEEPCCPYTAYLHDNDLDEIHFDDFRRRQKEGAFAATFPTPLPDHGYCDNWIAEQGLRLLREAPADKPWHLVVNWAGPHDPVDITESMTPWYADADFPQPNRNTQFSPAKHVEIRRNYSAMVENIDRWVGRILDEVERRGELDNTLIVFSSDHGEMLGDHDLWKKRLPYHPSVGVPFTVAGPGVRQGHVSDALVSVMDIAATFVDFAGLDAPAEMDSRSLKPLLAGATETHRDVVLSGLDPWRMIYDGRYKLIRGFDPAVGAPNKNSPAYPAAAEPPPLLFDLTEDPLENSDLAAAAPEQVERLTAALHDSIG